MKTRAPTLSASDRIFAKSAANLRVRVYLWGWKNTSVSTSDCGRKLRRNAPTSFGWWA